MATHIHEWHGYLASDRSSIAAAARHGNHCPFLNGACEKPNGVCSVEYAANEPVAICPIRMYYDDHRVLRDIAENCFSNFGPVRAPGGTVLLHRGDSVKAAAISAGQHTVGVFGKGWGGEIKLPPTTSGGGGYSIDFVLVAVDPGGDPVGIVPVEVQTIDTTGSYSAAVTALRTRGVIERTGSGMNWENVNKRILPQLIVKGLMLQAERLCANGIFFLAPEPVYERIMGRLGGPARLREIPRQPASITFARVAYGPSPAPGAVPAMTQKPWRTVSTSDLSLAFITPENLPPAGSYETRVRAKL